MGGALLLVARTRLPLPGPGRVAGPARLRSALGRSLPTVPARRRRPPELRRRPPPAAPRLRCPATPPHPGPARPTLRPVPRRARPTRGWTAERRGSGRSRGGDVGVTVRRAERQNAPRHRPSGFRCHERVPVPSRPPTPTHRHFIVRHGRFSSELSTDPSTTLARQLVPHQATPRSCRSRAVGAGHVISRGALSSEFRDPPALPHEVVAETLERALRDHSAEGEVASVLVGTALNDDDGEFVEHWCVQVVYGADGFRGSPSSFALGTTCLLPGADWEQTPVLGSQMAPKSTPQTTQGPDPQCGSGP